MPHMVFVFSARFLLLFFEPSWVLCTIFNGMEQDGRRTFVTFLCILRMKNPLHCNNRQYLFAVLLLNGQHMHIDAVFTAVVSLVRSRHAILFHMTKRSREYSEWSALENRKTTCLTKSKKIVYIYSFYMELLFVLLCLSAKFITAVPGKR